MKKKEDSKKTTGTKKKNAGTKDKKEKEKVEPKVEQRKVSTTEFLPYKFNEAELNDLSNNLAALCTRKVDLETEKRANASNFKGQIDTCAADIQKTSILITRKEEMRNIKCEISMNDPNPGRKICRRVDNGAVVWERDMTPSEMQLELNLDTKEKATGAMVVHSAGDDNNLADAVAKEIEATDIDTILNQGPGEE